MKKLKCLILFALALSFNSNSFAEEKNVEVNLKVNEITLQTLLDEENINACYPEKCDPETGISCCGWSECVEDYRGRFWCEPDPY